MSQAVSGGRWFTHEANVTSVARSIPPTPATEASTPAVEYFPYEDQGRALRARRAAVPPVAGPSAAARAAGARHIADTDRAHG